MNFPSSPTLNQLWPDPPLPGVPQWRFDGTRWIDLSVGAAFLDSPQDGATYGRRDAEWNRVASMSVGTVAPSSPAAGDYWLDPTTNRLRQWDAAGDRWLSISPPRFRIVFKGYTPGNWTYTQTDGLVYAIVEVQGAGGAGGSALGNGLANVGGGGGGGAYGKGVFAAAQLGASVSVSVGAGGAAGAPGGNTAFGTLLIAGGGYAAGVADGSSGYGTPGSGQASVTSVLANIMRITGPAGSWGIVRAGNVVCNGGEGGAVWGGAVNYPAARLAGDSTTGNNGGLGQGGGGAVSNQQNTSTWFAGGLGGEGWCAVTEFCLDAAPY